MTFAVCTSTLEAARAPIVTQPIVAAAQQDAVAGGVAFLDAHDVSRSQFVPFGELEELAILIADARDGHGRIQRARQQAVVVGHRHGALRAGYGIAVRIDRGTPQHLVDPIDEPIRDRVLQVLGLVVHFGPAHTHHLHQEQLDQAVAAQDERRELLAGRRQPHPDVRLVTGQPCVSQRLDHRRRRPGDHADRRGELAHRHEGFGVPERNLGLKNGFQVVFNGM